MHTCANKQGLLILWSMLTIQRIMKEGLFFFKKKKEGYSQASPQSPQLEP